MQNETVLQKKNCVFVSNWALIMWYCPLLFGVPCSELSDVLRLHVGPLMLRCYVPSVLPATLHFVKYLVTMSVMLGNIKDSDKLKIFSFELVQNVNWHRFPCVLFPLLSSKWHFLFWWLQNNTLKMYFRVFENSFTI